MRTPFRSLLAGTCLALLGSSLWAGPEIRGIDSDTKTGTSRDVVVGPAALVHTAQLLPHDREGKLAGKGRPREQVAQLFANLTAALGSLPSKPGLRDRVVKVNVYVARADVIPHVQQGCAAQFRGTVQPAVTYVVTSLPDPEALVALDAVVAVDEAPARVKLLSTRDVASPPCGAPLAILPAGPRVYVAGQAERGELPEATRKTLESLRATLRYLGLADADVVQLKAFLTPMSRVEEVAREVTRFYGEGKTPPVVFVEWKSPATTPIEIELIAAARRGKEKPADSLEYLTPPGMQASPIYSRVARAHHDRTIYISGLYGPSGRSGEAQVLAIFDELGELLKKTGSDFKHLAKATYYVATEDTSRKLNELRPRFYDPKRPPSASKAMVGGSGREGCGITLDMIAVPAP
jgi:enamine deaminase RidA (YjgF/YER057c/UK114 family)